MEFDASVALVDDFRLGEEVHVEVARVGNSWHVVRIWPDDPHFKPPTPPNEDAPPLELALADKVRSLLADIPLSESYSVQALSTDYLILHGDEGNVYTTGPDLLLFHEPIYVELTPFVQVKSLRLATRAERDYLQSRLPELASDHIAITVVDTSDRFNFIIARRVIYQSRPPRPGA